MERKYVKKEKAPYKLIIRTNSYTGNFDRELVAYSIGILDEIQEDYADSYKKAFWTRYGGNGCNSLEEYNKFEEEYKIKELNRLYSDAEDFLKELEEKDPEAKARREERKKAREKKEYEEDINRLYDTYLCYTYQTVDDWEQDTFYNIDFYKDDSCNSIIIQLTQPLNEKFETLVTNRIKEFFENDIYNVISDYDWVCSFGEKRNGKEDYKLLDLELVDENDNVIKKYV